MDPISRALVELSLVRGIDDAEIAAAMGSDQEFVARAREQALRDVAARITADAADADLAELERVVRAAIAAAANGAADEQDDADPLGAYVPGPQLDREATRPHLQTAPTPDWVNEPPQPFPRSRQRRRSLPILIGALALLTVVAVVLALRGSDGGGTNSRTSAPTPTPPASTPTAKSTELAALPGANGNPHGTASIEHGSLHLSVSGLPDPKGGTYAVWLYNSLMDSKRIGTGRGSRIDLDATLPGGYQRYELIDVSLEPADGNPNHSGMSVVRAPLAKLGR